MTMEYFNSMVDEAVNKVLTRGDESCNLHIAACHPDVTRLQSVMLDIIHNRCCLDGPYDLENEDGYTALMLACATGDYKCVSVILHFFWRRSSSACKFMTYLNNRNSNYRFSALDICLIRSNFKLARLLLACRAAIGVLKHNWTTFHLLVKSKSNDEDVQLEVFRIMCAQDKKRTLFEYDLHGGGCLHNAILSGKFKLFCAILDYAPTLMDGYHPEHGSTPLFYCSIILDYGEGGKPIFPNIVFFEELIRRKANINHVTTSGRSILRCYLRTRNLALARRILDLGGKVRTSGICAAFEIGDSEMIFELLSSTLLELNQPRSTEDCRFSLDAAIDYYKTLDNRRDEIIEKLLDEGAKVSENYVYQRIYKFRNKYDENLIIMSLGRAKRLQFHKIPASLAFRLVVAGLFRVLKQCRFTRVDLEEKARARPLDRNLQVAKKIRFWGDDALDRTTRDNITLSCFICAEKIKKQYNQNAALCSDFDDNDICKSSSPMCYACMFLSPVEGITALEYAVRKRKKDMVEHLRFLYTDAGQLLVKNDMLSLAETFINAKLYSIRLLEAAESNLVCLGLSNSNISMLRRPFKEILEHK